MHPNPLTTATEVVHSQGDNDEVGLSIEDLEAVLPNEPAAIEPAEEAALGLEQAWVEVQGDASEADNHELGLDVRGDDDAESGAFPDGGGDSSSDVMGLLDQREGGPAYFESSAGTDEEPVEFATDLDDFAALPALDQDSDDDVDTEDLFLEADEHDIPRWATTRWTFAQPGGPSVPSTAVAVASGVVLAGGEVALVVDEHRMSARPVGPGIWAHSVAVTNGTLYMLSSDGELLMSEDAGRTVRAAGPWHGGGRGALAATTDQLWIHSGESLWAMSPSIMRPRLIRSVGVVRACAAGDVIVALTQSIDGPSIERLSDGESDWTDMPLGGAVRVVADAPDAFLAASDSGRLVAISDGVYTFVSRDGGVTFQSLRFGHVVAITFAGDSAGASLLAAVCDDSDGCFLVEAPPDRVNVRLAELPIAADPEAKSVNPGAISLAWDATRDVLWVGSPKGLLAIARPAKH